MDFDFTTVIPGTQIEKTPLPIPKEICPRRRQANAVSKLSLS